MTTIVYKCIFLLSLIRNIIISLQWIDNIFTYIYPEWNAFKELPSTSKKEKEPRYEEIKPKYKVGDLVYVVLETPEDALGNKQSGLFRNGDYRLTKEPHKITKRKHSD